MGKIGSGAGSALQRRLINGSILKMSTRLRYKTSARCQGVLFLCGGLCGLNLGVLGQSVSDYAVRASASASARVQTNPPSIALTWPADPGATGYAVYRKSRDASSWGTGTVIDSSATSYVDSSVTNGGAYEYRIKEACATPRAGL
jgi:hypothetical protein